MRKRIVPFVLLAFLCTHLQLMAQTKNNCWSAAGNLVLQPNKAGSNHAVFIPLKYKTFRLDESAMRQLLAKAPPAKGTAAGISSLIIGMPNAKGETELFKVAESAVMSPALAAKYPQLQSYTGQGITDPSATIHFDITPKGFHAMILSGTRNTIYINPADKSKGLYIVFDKEDTKQPATAFTCKVQNSTAAQRGTGAAKNADDNILRTYRFAVTVGGQFSELCLDGSEVTDAAKKLSVLSTLVTDLVRVNGIFERDFDVHLNYVNNEDTIIFLDSKTDPFDDDATSGYTNGGWNKECKKTLDKYIGNSSYDIGHLLMGFATGGNAGCIGCVCDSATKGTAVTGYDVATGDPFVVDFWSHEIGHQFGGSHTFDYSDESSGVQMEPGSGSTIMGYAGTTGNTDVQPHSDDYFHAASIQQVTDYIKSIDNKKGPTLQQTNNHTPAADAGADFTIPVSTPFVLTGATTDADNADVSSYVWEQFDDIASGYNEFPKITSTAGAIFRSFPPTASKNRTFPVLDTILAGKTKWKWEALPAVGRTMRFRFTVRDNHVGGGSNNSDDMKVTVDKTAGPFVVKDLDTATSWFGNSLVTIKWNVANTTNNRIKCSKVNIEFSADGGHNFSTMLAASVDNDGEEVVVAPNSATTKGRIRIKAADNIFFDISNADITIVPVALPVTWLSFTAVKNANTVMLTWTTANEVNSSRFEIERSNDGVHYIKIGAAGAGNGKYNFEDAQPVAGNNYYRIGQVDNDGNYHYSSIAVVDIDKLLAAVTLYPNPAKSMANIKLNENAAHVAITLTDAAGKTVYTNVYASIAAGQVIKVPVSKFAAGVYVVKVKWDGGNFTQQLLVE